MGAETVEWITAVSTALAAIATVAAVLVALFWQDLRARRRRPQIEVRTETITYEFSSGEPWIAEHRLTVSNAPEKEPAEVEMLIGAAEYWGDELDVGPTFVDAEPLNWDSPLLGQEGRPRGTIPSGTSRRAYFACLGSRNGIFERHWPALNTPPPPDNDEFVGAFAVFPARNDRIRWFEIGPIYSVSLDVTVEGAVHSQVRRTVPRRTQARRTLGVRPGHRRVHVRLGRAARADPGSASVAVSPRAEVASTTAPKLKRLRKQLEAGSKRTESRNRKSARVQDHTRPNDENASATDQQALDGERAR